MMMLINHIPNHSHTLSFHSKNTINSLKIGKKSRKLGKVLEKESIVYCRLLKERGVVDYRQYY